MNDCAKTDNGLPLEHTPVAKCVQYQIVTRGLIDHPEQRQLLTRIDTLEFSKWEFKMIDQLTSWYDVFDVPWTCFACCSMSAKHADFCHSSCSYKNARMSILMVIIGIFL